jgi:DNA mismatch repair protein MutS
MTPMFVQYLALKDENPDALLFFRMGDFYEMFFEDAIEGASALELTLTARNKGGENPIPMCGVPHHAAARYIERLTAQGYKVAIAEQIEDPATAKGLVARAVVQVVTPGVVLDPRTIEATRNNFVVAICQSEDGASFGLAVVDISTGQAKVAAFDTFDVLNDEIARLEPSEAVVGTNSRERFQSVIHDAGSTLSVIEDEAFSNEEASREIKTHFAVASPASLGLADAAPTTGAMGALIRYIRDTNAQALSNLHTVSIYSTYDHLVVDETTRRNLELFRSLSTQKRKGSLLHILDKCATVGGSRKLREWLGAPLISRTKIEDRASAVEAAFHDEVHSEEVRGALREVADIARLTARVAQRTANGRDLVALKRSLRAIPDVMSSLSNLSAFASWMPSDPCTDILDGLDFWLASDPPASISEGGLIRQGAHEELDELLALSVNGLGLISALEEAERQATEITSLKVRRNKVFGYYIEVTRANLHRVPDRYVRKQTLSNCERYITPDLKELEESVLGADERRKALEMSLFTDLRERVASQGERLITLADAVATLDLLTSLGTVARREHWVRPTLDDGTALDIVGGRHPVVEASLVEDRFVPNDVQLDTKTRRLIVLTGPNMSGKSTIMRTIAIVALLAQMGSFVPATRAHIGVVDRLFTRVGASDNLASGQSTFMVEMAETSSILRSATGRSLVLLDEIGRGTSTYDGLSIAWSVAEHLVDRIGCRAIFATHYHELCELAQSRPTVVNQSVAVKEWGEQIIFLRRLVDGGASRSYGVQCARLAGLPTSVTDRATEILGELERRGPRNDAQQLSLFGDVRVESSGRAEPDAPPHSALLRIAEINPDTLTPMQALTLVAELKRMMTDDA